jgi:hypothetical protein
MRLDFIGVGFGRTGSNWLCNCLFEHPEISIPKFNLHIEINEFPEECGVMGLRNYVKKFRNCDFDKKVGEISTMIIMKKRSARLLKELFPEVKIIIYRRLEKDRVKSVYNITKFHDMLDVEEGDLEINQEKFVEPWIKEFGKERVFVFDMDEPDKQRELNRLFKFLDVKKFVPAYLNIRTNTSYADVKKKIPRKSTHPFARKIINFVKPKVKGNKKLFYFMKRNMKMDYYYQLVNHRMSG